jgi:hypothetical protein
MGRRIIQSKIEEMRLACEQRFEFSNLFLEKTEV